MLQYLLDIYINKDSTNHIQAYDDQIYSTMTSPRIREIYEAKFGNKGYDKNIMESLSVIHLFNILTYFLKDEEKQKYFDRIKDPNMRQYFINFNS